MRGGLDNAVPDRGITAVRAGEITDDDPQIHLAARGDGGESLTHAIGITPDEGVIIQRIGQRDHRPKNSAQACPLVRIERREGDVMVQSAVGDKARLAARAGHRSDTVRAQGPREMQKLQTFQQLRETCHPGNTQPVQQGARTCVTAGQGGGMRDSRRLCGLGATCFQRHDRLAQPPCRGRHRLEAAQIADPLDMQPEGGDPRILKQCGADVREALLRLIACRGHIGQRQPAVLHGQVDRHVGALRQDRHTALAALATMLVGP